MTSLLETDAFTKHLGMFAHPKGAHLTERTKPLGDWFQQRIEHRLVANMVEYPAVARGRARFRFQVMATHTPDHIDTGVSIFRRSLAEARLQLAE